MTKHENETSDTESKTAGNIVKLPATGEAGNENAAVRFVKDHPVLTVAGGLAAGILAAAFIPRRNREYVARRTSDFADAVTTASLAMATQALEKAEAARSEVSDRAGAVVERASDLGERAVGRAQRLLPRSKPKTLGERLSVKAEEVLDRLQR